MKNIGVELVELWSGKEKSRSTKAFTTVISPCKKYSVFTVTCYEIACEIAREIPREIPCEIPYEILPLKNN